MVTPDLLTTGPRALAAKPLHELLSGRRRGLRAALARLCLRAAEVPYTLAVCWRNQRFDRHPQRVFRASVPVISVGNLTTGGTGKTPLVEWMARWFCARGVRVTLISRGYGAERGARNDEAMELEQRLPDVPHLQNPDRAQAARIAVDELDCQLIILDDAFQHRAIARDLDIVLIDATEPFGYGHLLPRGLLREPLGGLARAHVVALSRADYVDRRQREATRQQVSRYAPQADWVELAHVPTQLLSAEQATMPLGALAGRGVAAFCGIGNPSSFRHTLAQCGCRLQGLREFPDHHPYSRPDIESLQTWIASLPAVDYVVCSHKDLVKIGLTQLAGRGLWAVTIRVDFRQGQAQWERRLRSVVETIGRTEGGLMRHAAARPATGRRSN